MKSGMKRFIFYGLFISIVVLLVIYIQEHLFMFSTLRLVNSWMIIILGLIVLINSTLNGLVTDALVSVFGIRLSVKEWFGLSIITTFYNTFTPFRGGMMARAAYLKEKHNFPYTNFLAALMGTYVIDFMVYSLFGLISLILLYNEMKVFSWIVLLIFLAFFIPLLIILVFSPSFMESRNKYLNKIIRVLNGWNLIRKNRRMVATSFIRNILQVIIMTTGTLLSYSIFGIHISIAAALFLTTLGLLGMIISIAPAGLGIPQVIAIFSALVINISPAQSLPVSLLNSAVLILIVFSLGPIFSYLLIKHKPKEKK